MGLLARGMSRLARVQAENESETVNVSRRITSGGSYVFQNRPVVAVIAGPGFGQQSSTEIPGRIGDWAIDFVIRVVDWQTAGCVGVPLEGDLITRSIAIGGTTATHFFRVVSQSNIPAWDWGEPERVTYRIHAQYESAT